MAYSKEKLKEGGATTSSRPF